MLGQISLDRDAIEEIVRNMVSEFSGKDEKLEVFLCPQDLSLLKSMADSEKPAVEEEKGLEEQSYEGNILNHSPVEQIKDNTEVILIIRRTNLFCSLRSEQL